MDRIEINAQTGEISIIPLTEEEIATIQNVPQQVAPPNWDGLTLASLRGELYPLFDKLRKAAIATNKISTIRGDLMLAITTVQDEDALAFSLQLLVENGYVFTQAEKDLWNSTIASLGFSEAVRI